MTDEPTCCEYACYEDPGCACGGCVSYNAREGAEVIDASLRRDSDKAAETERLADVEGSPHP